jgi:hypothetical protein
MFCGKCGIENSKDSNYCPVCGEQLVKRKTSSTPLISTTQQYSNAQPVLHFVLLSILTFGIYEFYWFYRNWKHIKVHKNLDIRPGWRTVGLFIPIYGIVLAYRQLREIRDFSKELRIDKTYSPGWILFGWLTLNALWKLPDPFWFLSFLSVVPLAVVQGVLNSYWKKEQPGFTERTKFSGGQIAILVIGGIWWILLLIGTLSP